MRSIQQLSPSMSPLSPRIPKRQAVQSVEVLHLSSRDIKPTANHRDSNSLAIVTANEGLGAETVITVKGVLIELVRTMASITRSVDI